MKEIGSSLFRAIALALVFGCAQRLVAQVPTASPSAAVEVSPGAAEVVRLAESGVGDDVVLAFIQNSTSTFNLSADQILYLKDLGISSPVITAMLGHDGAVKNQLPQEPPSVPPPSAPVEAPLTPPATYVATPPV